MNKQHKFDDDVCIGIVKINDSWRYFYGHDYQFLLDWNKYFPEQYLSENTHKRVGAEVVDKDNFELWAKSLEGELTFEELASAKYEDGKQVKLTYFIDFNRQLWVGYAWFQDQSPLQDYQPDGWIAIEDTVYAYLPKKIVSLWDESKEIVSVSDLIIVATINARDFVVVSPHNREPKRTYHKSRVSYDIRLSTTPRLSIVWLRDNRREVIYDKPLPDLSEHNRYNYVHLILTHSISPDRVLTITMEVEPFGKDTTPEFVDTFTHPLA